MATLSPIITGTPGEPPSYNVGMAETFSWIPIENDANRPLFARAGYITNLSDLSISLSASDINIGSVELADGVNPSIRATIVSLGTGEGNALKVLTQDLESSIDDITIGDKAGNFAAVNKSLSALRVFEVAPVTAVSITNQLTGLTVLNQITSVSVLNTVAISGSVTIANPISSVSLVNQISAFTVLNPVTSINISNTTAVSGSVTILNPISSVSLTNQISSFSITNPTTAVNVLNTVAVSGSVTVINSISSVSLTNQLTGITILNPTTAVNVLNTVAVSGSLSVINSVSSVSITNQISAFTVLNPVTAINISNTAAISGSVTIVNPITAVTVTNPTTALNVLNTVAVSGSVTITNPTSAVYILNTAAVSGSIAVLNPVSAVSVTNQLTSITVTNPTTGVNVLNPIALKDLGNNNVSVTPATSSLNVNVTNPVPVSFVAGALNTDAFGRLRVSNPLTLFDSSHRYRDNNLWCSLTAVGGSTSFNQNQGLIEMNVSNLSGSSVIRETTKVFSYQSGKGLLVMNTFVMAPSAQNAIQKVGYYGQDNGIYFQLDGGTPSFVERSLVNGSPSSETIVPQTSWNGDRLDGTGPSGFKLDVTKAQIQCMDIEWLGVGTVRTGFIINGQFILCHSFHHANLIFSTYITTASLPLRYEIINKGATDGSRTMKQICSTVISEGGYELRGLQQAASIPISSPRTFASVNTYYPIISIRLKTTPDRLDAIVILTALSILGQGNGINYNWQVRASGVTTGGNWVDAGVDSAVEYNITGTSYAGGRILASGFLNASNQASPNLDILKEALFKFQLERNNLTKTPYEITLVAATDTTNSSGMFASMDWEEISR